MRQSPCNSCKDVRAQNQEFRVQRLSHVACRTYFRLLAGQWVPRVWSCVEYEDVCVWKIKREMLHLTILSLNSKWSYGHLAREDLTLAKWLVHTPCKPEVRAFQNHLGPLRFAALNRRIYGQARNIWPGKTKKSCCVCRWHCRNYSSSRVTKQSQSECRNREIKACCCGNRQVVRVVYRILMSFLLKSNTHTETCNG